MSMRRAVGLVFFLGGAVAIYAGFQEPGFLGVFGPSSDSTARLKTIGGMALLIGIGIGLSRERSQ